MKIYRSILLLGFCLVTGTAMAANDAGPLCDLIIKFQDVFKLLRTLAFVGAGMLVAKYAWEAISTGKINNETDLTKAAKSVGLPMIIGFILLFGIGTLLQVLSSATGAEIMGCNALFNQW